MVEDAAMLVRIQPVTEAIDLRSRLRHSWLENEILSSRRTGVAIAKVHQLDMEHPAKRQLSEALKAGGCWFAPIQDVRRLAALMTNAFSPDLLIDSPPLSDLPLRAREVLRQTLRQRYRLESDIEALRAPIVDMATEMFDALHCLATSWSAKPSASPDEIAAAVESVRDAGQRLLSLLTRVPAGVVLP